MIARNTIMGHAWLLAAHVLVHGWTQHAEMSAVLLYSEVAIDGVGGAAS